MESAETCCRYGPATCSVGLQILQQGHAIGFGQVRAKGVAAVSVADARGIDEAILLAAVRIDDEAELDRIIFAAAEREGLGPLVRRKQQVIKGRDRSVMQIGR